MTTKLAPPKGAPMQHTRTMAVEIDRAALEERSIRAEGEDDGLIPIALSSEYPVERYDWWEGERYAEILDHAPDAIDLSRAERGLPFLDSHRSYDGAAQMGRIMNVRVEDGKLRGDVKFSARQEAQDYRRDMLDGIRTDISVGYQIDPNNIEISQKDGELKTVRVKRWTPFEASGVAVPADPTVGVGRSNDTSELSPESVAKIAAAIRNTITTTAPQAKESPMSQDTATPTNGAAPGVTVTRDNEAAKEMQDVSKVAGELGLSDIFAKGFTEGKKPNDIRNDLMAEMKQRLDRGTKAVANPVQHVVDLTEKQEREYSYARAILSAVDGTDCLETEVSRAIGEKLNGRTFGTGKGMRIYLPTTIRSMPKGFGDVQFTRAGLDSGTANKGTELKYVQAGSFIDMLRNKSRVLQLGATYLAGLDGPVTFPKQTGAGTFSWMGENPSAAVSVSELALGTVSLSAKTGMSATKFSRQLLRQAVIDVENLVRSDLAAIHGLGIDTAAIKGAGGTANDPVGLLNNTSIGSVVMGTNGGAPGFTDMVKLETNVEKSNANTGPMGYLTTPGIKGTLKTTQVFASTNGVPVWLGGEEGEVNGYRAYSTNQVPSNLTKGTSTTVCHAVLFGAWQELLIGEWGVMEVLVDPYTLAGSGMIAVTSFQMLDLIPRHAESFAAIKDALPAAGF